MRTESFIPRATRLRHSTEMPGVRYQGGLTSSRPDVIEGPGGIRLSRSPKPGAPLEMLVLTRHANESININDIIKVMVVDIRGDKVRIAVKAPNDLSVHRQEVYKKIKAEGRDPTKVPQSQTDREQDDEGIGLVLSRHRDESIVIGDDIVITVVDIRGDKVRLGINAPIEIPVHRQEVYEAIQRENKQAAQINPPGQREPEPPKQ